MGSPKKSPAVTVRRRTSNHSHPLTPMGLKCLYHSMLRSRLAQEHIRSLLLQRDSSSDSMFTRNREATVVGAAMEILPEDTLVASPDDLVVHIVKGTPLRFLYAQLHASATSPGQNRSLMFGNSFALPNFAIPSSTAAQVSTGTGAALACKRHKKPNVVVTLSSEASASAEFWDEVMSFAGNHKLPIVHVLESSVPDESRSSEPQNPSADLNRATQRCGSPLITVDGNDVVAVYRVCHEARDRARRGYGPTTAPKNC